MYSIYVLVYFIGVQVSITTSSNVVLNHPGYDTALVMCVYNHDPNVTPDIITWTMSTNNSTTSDVTDHSIQDGSSSTLNITLSDAGTVVLTCESDLVYNNDQSRTRLYSNVSKIIVKGILIKERIIINTLL